MKPQETPMPALIRESERFDETRLVA